MRGCDVSHSCCGTAAVCLCGACLVCPEEGRQPHQRLGTRTFSCAEQPEVRGLTFSFSSERGRERLQVCVGSCESVAQKNRFFIATQMTFQCWARSGAANICEHNVLLGFSETAILSDKRPTATQENNLTYRDHFSDTGLCFWKVHRGQAPHVLGGGVWLTYLPCARS